MFRAEASLVWHFDVETKEEAEKLLNDRLSDIEANSDDDYKGFADTAVDEHDHAYLAGAEQLP